MTCEHKVETARALTVTDAERWKRRLAADLRAARPGLSPVDAEELAMASILARRPTLVVTCDACGRERLE